MNRLFFGCAAAVALLCNPAQSAAPNTGFPFTDEDLNYAINWPSGLSLGEGRLHAKRSGTEWNFALSLDAGVTGFALKDDYKATSSSESCTASFTKNIVHGAKKTEETTTVDRTKGIATRVTSKGGGKSDMQVSDCVKDALTYLFWSRRELGQGRVPRAQQVLFGAIYRAAFEYAGAPTIRVNDQPVQTDKMICTMKGPSSDLKFEIYFARDAARTPLLFKVPLPMGTFRMELVR